MLFPSPKFVSSSRLSLNSVYSNDKLSEYNDDVDDFTDLYQIKKILKLAPKHRTARNINTLLQFTSDIDFFRKLNEESSVEAHLKCCQFMHYECMPAMTTVFDFGDKGQKFYIILQGAVRVLVPSKGEEGLYDQVCVLNKGNSFGELALTKNMPRAARIITKEETHFATLHKLDFKSILGKLTEQTLNNRVSFLQNLPVFSFWTQKALVKLSYYFREQRFTRKQTVFRQGDNGEDLYFIKEGEFQLNKAIKQEVSKKIMLSKTRKVQLNAQVALLGVGEFFGDDDVIAKRPRSTTCVCHSPGVLLAISKEHFLQRLSNTDITAYLKARNETKDWSRTKRIENFSSLVTKGHLASESPPRYPSPILSPQNLSRRRMLRLEFSRLSLGGNTERKNQSRTKLYDSSARNSPDTTPLKFVSRAKTGSLDCLKSDVPISVLSLTKRLYEHQKRRAKTPQIKKVVNIHTTQTKKPFTLPKSARLTEALRLPFKQDRLTPCQSSSRTSRRTVALISVQRFEVKDDDYSACEQAKPAKRLLSTRHSMFRVSSKGKFQSL